MKNLLIIFLLTLMCNVNTAYSQDNGTSREKPVLKADQQQAVADITAMDPKLTAEEIENLKLAVIGAPTNAEPIDDNRMDNPPDVSVHAPWKAEPIEQREDVFQQAGVQPTSAAAVQTGTQPEPSKSNSINNNRKINGPADQPQPATSENVTNFRNTNGPQNQPDPHTKPGGK